LMDKQLFDFAGLAPTGLADEGGDKAFDEDMLQAVAAFGDTDSDHDLPRIKPSVVFMNDSGAIPDT